MGTANNTIFTRVQSKSDTEINWNKVAPQGSSPGFIPLQGEIIIYLPDSSHSYSRLKVGDGRTNVVNLPFIDAGTLNGDETFVLKYNTTSNFPTVGSTDKLYIDLSTANIYYYTTNSGYIQLSQLIVSKTTIHDVVFWGAGAPTEVKVINGVLTVRSGTAPQLQRANTTVVTNVVGGINT